MIPKWFPANYGKAFCKVIQLETDLLGLQFANEMLYTNQMRS